MNAEEPEEKSDDYWKQIFAAAKARTELKAQLLRSLHSNKIEITDDLRMTEIDKRMLEHHEDQCRVCLENGNGFLNLFKESNETPPSMVDKLMECSRISQVNFLCTVADSLRSN